MSQRTSEERTSNTAEFGKPMCFLIGWPDEGMSYFLAAQRTLAGLGLIMRLSELIDLGVAWYAISRGIFGMSEFAIKVVEEFESTLIGPVDNRDQAIAIIEESCTIIHEYLELSIPHMFKIFNQKLYVKAVAPSGILLETRSEH